MKTKVVRKTNYTRTARLILAPSGTGKSHWIKEHPQLNVVDGDVVISICTGWPSDEHASSKWWTDSNATIMHATHFATIVTFSALTGQVVLFNGRNPELMQAAVALVIPHPATVERQTGTPQHTTEDQITRLITEYPTAPRFATFDEAYDWLQRTHPADPPLDIAALHQHATPRNKKRG